MPEPPIKKILIVDDERELAQPLAMRLLASGKYEVAVALDGDDGLRKAAYFQPDALLVDLAMPGMDGWELCRRLRGGAQPAPARIVVMTAWASKDLLERARREGVHEVLLKPFEERDLLAALEAP